MGATYIISAYFLFGRHLAVKKTRKCILKLGGLCPSSKFLWKRREQFLENNSKTQVPILKLFVWSKAHYFDSQLAFQEQTQCTVSMSAVLEPVQTEL